MTASMGLLGVSDNALSILKLLGQKAEIWSLNDLSKMLAISIADTWKAVRELENRNLIARIQK